MNTMPQPFLDALVALVGSEELALKWWNSPNLAFNKLCPRDVCLEEVRSYLLDHLGGEYM